MLWISELVDGQLKGRLEHGPLCLQWNFIFTNLGSTDIPTPAPCGFVTNHASVTLSIIRARSRRDVLAVSRPSRNVGRNSDFSEISFSEIC